MPKDPFILFSVVNTQLRDCFSTLEELCAEHGEDVDELTTRLEKAGFVYDREQNQFK